MSYYATYVQVIWRAFLSTYMAIFPQTLRAQPITDEICFRIPAGTGKLDKFGVHVPVRNVRESLSQISSILKNRERERRKNELSGVNGTSESVIIDRSDISVVSGEMNVRSGV